MCVPAYEMSSKGDVDHKNPILCARERITKIYCIGFLIDESNSWR